MRIITTTMCYPTPDQPDMGVFVQRRAAALAAHYDLRVVSPRPWCPLLRRGRLCPAQEQPLPVSYPKMFSIPVLGWATDGLAYARALHNEIKRLGRIDLIDAHFEYPDGVGAWLAARRLGIPVVVTLRGKLVSLSRKRFRRAQIRAMLRDADGLIAVSASLAALAREVAGRDLPIEVIPNGVDAGVFHRMDKSAARAALGWESHRRHVLCVGHYQRLKGFDRLVSVWPQVREQAGDVRLVLVGSRRGERGFHEQLRCQVAAGGLGHCVSLLDAVDARTLNLMFNAADLSVNASRSEGWCNAIAESLAAGTPVVATDVGGNREQLHPNHLGLLVPDGDAAALASAIVAGLHREWDRDRIAAHGQSRGWEQVALEVAKVFERVVGCRASRGARPESECLTRQVTAPQAGAVS
ncbi:MAG: glycosyltransferase [Phycisphaerae bacterium]|jgi:teichuronic acid biosynthesis glycosyltransferase TuaC|nr:glycosyltransferase family 4 protein [Phycisphaerae bacterium]HOJ53112.1 glycosyltransferase [Phycisphaerae bacterium]HOL24849.1 glycosyltransferase [Phycisphaerae bacterium]HPP19385.1 glycosyltransferase [Phycisphaerae bacterium]HXK86341.1 glycosyltransferase [Phycisphaerae bacterium]